MTVTCADGKVEPDQGTVSTGDRTSGIDERMGRAQRSIGPVIVALILVGLPVSMGIGIGVPWMLNMRGDSAYFVTVFLTGALFLLLFSAITRGPLYRRMRVEARRSGIDKISSRIRELRRRVSPGDLRKALNELSWFREKFPEEEETWEQLEKELIEIESARG